ncbi:hypothetical protein [Actinophytocola sp.]|uniref:hypothetical protein n=1 Tax=Actinophytocola sp. TaxID=1872138 RepID=UPI002D7F130A|nr:hypothetical protein [Actinophytocola sp.]HET9142147.1 hypothetical protein [Actinophytocola sp.]
MRRRFAIALVLVFAGCLAALASAGTATAAPPPIVVGSCATSVQGVPGQPVSLAPGAVLGVVVDAVRAVDPLNLLWPTAQNTFAALPPIPIGALPTGTGYITGGTIASAVVAELNKIPLLGPVIVAVTGTVQGSLTSLCGITVTGANAAAAPVQDGAKAVADASQQATAGVLPGAPPLPGNPPAPVPGGGGGQQSPPPAGANQPVVGGASGGSGLSQYLWGRAPMADYGSIPFAAAGLFAPAPGVRYGGTVAGYTPQFGVLGADPQDGVRVAGNAEALHPKSGTRVALPVLLAVFALSGVTAALVRTWVLRRTPAG